MLIQWILIGALLSPGCTPSDAPQAFVLCGAPTPPHLEPFYGGYWDNRAACEYFAEAFALTYGGGDPLKAAAKCVEAYVP